MQGDEVRIKNAFDSDRLLVIAYKTDAAEGGYELVLPDYATYQQAIAIIKILSPDKKIVIV